LIRASALRTAEQIAVEAARGRKIVHWEGKVEWRERHWTAIVIALLPKQ
jgi:hypothetical protein